MATYFSDFDTLTGWTDTSGGGCTASISPAGQLYLDCRACSIDPSSAGINRVATTFAANEEIIYKIKFKADKWDNDGNVVINTDGLKFGIDGGTKRWSFVVANLADNSTNGIWSYNGSDYAKIVTKTWDNEWHELKIRIHTNQTKVDIYDNNVLLVANNTTGAYASSSNGYTAIFGYGTIAGNGEYHIDSVKINISDGSPAMFYSQL